MLWKAWLLKRVKSKQQPWTIILLVYVGSIVDQIGLTNTNDKRSRDRYNVELRFKGYYISAILRLLTHRFLTSPTSLKNIIIYCARLTAAKRFFQICLLWPSDDLLTYATYWFRLNFLLTRLIPTHNSLPAPIVAVFIVPLAHTFPMVSLTTPSFPLVKRALSNLTWPVKLII